MFIGLWTDRRAWLVGGLAASLLAVSCGSDGGEAPDDVEFASLDNLVEVTGCVRVEGDSGYYNYSDSGWGWDSGSSSWFDSGSWSDSGGSGGSAGSEWLQFGVNFWSFYNVKFIFGDFDPQNSLHCRAFQKSDLQKHNVFVAF